MQTDKWVRFRNGVVYHGDANTADIRNLIQLASGKDKVPLILTDPPYGNIVDASWDKTSKGDSDAAFSAISWVRRWAEALEPGGAFYVFGGVGKVKFRPWFKFLSLVESHTPLEIAHVITWSKKRAYGVQNNYLFTREELVYLCNGNAKKPRCFHVPYLDKERGYAGFSAKYPAKSKFLRRTSVWNDVTEILRGKVHVCEKPVALLRIPIEVHTDPGELVVDPFCGSGSTGLAAVACGRKYLLIEKEEASFDLTCKRMRAVDG